MLKDRIKQYEPLWGSWHIEGFVGRGSFGNVFKISKEELGYKYISAVKVISVPSEEQYREAISNIHNDSKAMHSYFSDVVKNIVNEVNMLYQLKGNTNILNYEDHMVLEKENEFGWEILVRMEFADSLPEYMSKSTFTREQITRLGIEICSALDACMTEGIIHRDIKEENIFVSNKGVFKLGDFGIAKELSKSGRAASSKGTPLYMAPEVYKGEKYDNTVDIYSLGIVMYKLLNDGRLPFMPPYPQEIKYKDNEEAFIRRLSGEPLPIPHHVEVKLKNVLLKACEYDPSRRYQNPKEMKKDLEAAIDEMSDEEKREIVTSIRIRNSATGAEIHASSSSESIENTIMLDYQSDSNGKAEEKLDCKKHGKTETQEKVIERIRGTQIIAVAGTMARVGTTHTAINIAHFLSDKGFRIAVFEKHDSTAFKMINNAYREIENKDKSFRLAGIDYYPYSQYTKISELIHEGYHYIILDMGVYNDCDQEEFKRANVGMIVSGTKDWEINTLDELLNAIHLPDKTALYLTFTDQDIFKMITGSNKKNKFYRAPYNPQVFEAGNEAAAVFEEILNDILPDINDKKKKRRKTYTIHRNPVFKKILNNNNQSGLSFVDDSFDIMLPNKNKESFLLLKYLLIIMSLAGAATLIAFLMILALKGKPGFDFSLF